MIIKTNTMIKIMHNMVIEDKFDTCGSMVDFNVMSVPKVDMVVDDIE